MCSCSTSPRRISISATRSTCCEYFATFRNRGMWLSSCPSTNSSSRRKSADKVICVKDGRVFRAGAPGGHIHARDDWRALWPSTWHLQRALRQRGNWAPTRRCAHVRHRWRRYGVGCVSPAHPAGQGVLRGRSARRGHRLRARARPSDGMRGRARLRANRG